MVVNHKKIPEDRKDKKHQSAICKSFLKLLKIFVKIKNKG